MAQIIVPGILGFEHALTSLKSFLDKKKQKQIFMLIIKR